MSHTISRRRALLALSGVGASLFIGLPCALASDPEAGGRPTTKVSNLARYYRELWARSDLYPANQLKIYVGDTATPGFKAGPFQDGDVVRISRGAVATIRPGTYGLAAIITVKGEPIAWAEDADGRVGNPVVLP